MPCFDILAWQRMKHHQTLEEKKKSRKGVSNKVNSRNIQFRDMNSTFLIGFMDRPSIYYTVTVRPAYMHMYKGHIS